MRKPMIFCRSMLLWSFMVVLGCSGPQDQSDGAKEAENDGAVNICVSFSENEIEEFGADLDKSVDEVREVLHHVITDFVNVAVKKRIKTEPITLNKADSLNDHYWDNRWTDRFPNDETRGVLVELKDVVPDVLKLIESGQIPSLEEAIMYAYFIRYKKDGTSPNRRTPHEKDDISVAIQLGKYVEEEGEVVVRMFENNIYDYGDLCPPKCPKEDGAVYGEGDR